MEPRDFKELTARRATRARDLATSYPEAAVLLEFLARVAEFQGQVDVSDPLASLPPLLAMARAHGPRPLAAVAEGLDRARCAKAMEHYRHTADASTPESFFARALLMPVVAASGDVAAPRVPSGVSGGCPRCGHPPQVGILQPEGQGTRLVLVCSLCATHYETPRARCVACGQADERRLGYYKVEGSAPWQAVVCEVCERYLHVVAGEVAGVVADVDEVAGVALDAWAHERGWRKVHPNLVGI